MSYAILRIEKLKTFGHINAAANHNLRLKNCSNADPSRAELNIPLVDKGKNLAHVVKVRLSEAGISKWRRDAVLASELLLTASPDFFSTEAQTRAWIDENHRWLHETFGENIVSSVVHMDEQTPHIHCILVPIKDGRLSHKNLFGGARDAFVAWQDAYALRMARFGLERGVGGSTAKHEKIRKFYTAVNATPDVVLNDMPSRPRLEQVAETIGVFRKERVLPFDAVMSLIRSYRKRMNTYLAEQITPLYAQIDRLKGLLRAKEVALLDARNKAQRAQSRASDLNEEVARKEHRLQRLLSFLTDAEKVAPNLVDLVMQERQRKALADAKAIHTRSAGVEGGTPLGTHSTLLSQRVGSFGQTAEAKASKLKLV